MKDVPKLVIAARADIATHLTELAVVPPDHTVNIASMHVATALGVQIV